MRSTLTARCSIKSTRLAERLTVPAHTYQSGGIEDTPNLDSGGFESPPPAFTNASWSTNLLSPKKITDRGIYNNVAGL